MKAYRTPIIFAAGLGAGWLIFGGGARKNAEPAENPSSAPVITKREVRPATSPHEAKFRSFAKELPKLSEKDREAFTKSLAPGDRAAAIEALLSQSEPACFTGRTTTVIREILNAWADEDFDKAWAWCREIEGDGNRRFVTKSLIEGLTYKDPDRALALHVEMKSEEPDFSSNVPRDLLREAASRNAASYLDLLRKLPSAEGSVGIEMGFAADFDFQQAADGLVALRGGGGGLVSLKYPPVHATNFLSAWAARDADAAYVWFSKNQRAASFSPYEHLLAGNEMPGFGKLLEGIEMQGIPGASYTWAADKLNESDADRDAIIRSLTNGSSDRRRIVINSIAQAMPDTVSRDRFLGDVVTMNNWSDRVVVFSYALTQMSSPAARLETLRQLRTNGHLNATQIPDTQLQQWGLTREQVEQAEASGR